MGLVACLIGILVPLTSAEAQTVEWKNNGATALDNGNNWVGDAVPTSNQIAAFTSTTFSPNELSLQSSGVSFGGISLAAGAGALSFTAPGGGQAKTVSVGTSGVVNSSTNPLTFDVTSKVNLSLSADASFTANGQILVLDDSGNGGTSGFTIGSHTLTLNGSDLTGSTIAKGFTGTGGTIVKSGTGTWTLTGANTYTGTTTVSQGTLSVSNVVVTSNSSNLGNAASAVVLGGATTAGTLSYTGNSAIYTRGFTVNAGGGEVDVTTAGQTLTIGTGGVATNGLFSVGGAGNTTVNSVVSGGGGLAKTGSGTLVLAGVNTFTGGVTLSSGTLTVNSGATLASNTTPGSLTVDGGTLNLNNAAQTISALAGGGGAINLAANYTLTANQSTATSFAGTLNGTGASFIKSGAGTLTLSGNNSYTGTTLINGGTLRLGATGNSTAGPLGAVSGGASTVANGATLDLNGFTLAMAKSLTVHGSGTSSSGALANSGVTAAIYSGAVTLGSAASIGGAGDIKLTTGLAGNFLLSKVGSGTLTLGTSSGARTGGAQIDSGTLRLGNSTALGATSQTITLAGGTLALGTDASVGSYPVAVAASSNIVSDRATSGSGLTHNLGSFSIGSNTLGVIRGENVSSGVAGVGFGATTLSGDATFSAGIGTQLTIASVAGANHSLTVTGAGDTTISGVVGTSTGGLTKAGTGTLILSGANSYSGGTFVNGGTVAISSAGNLGAPGSGVTFNGGALRATGTLTAGAPTTLASAGGTFDVASAITLTWNGNITGSGALTKIGAGLLELGGSNTYSGTTFVSQGTLKLLNSNALSPNTSFQVSPGAVFDANGFTQTLADLSGTGEINVGAGLTVQPSGPTPSTFSGTLGGTGGFTMSGTGTIVLAGINSYTGPTQISNGTVKLGIEGALPSGTPIQVASGAKLDLDGHPATIGSLSGSGEIVLGSGTLTINPTSGSSSFDGIISGPGGLVKNGGGTLILGGDQAFTGPTSILSGELKLTGTLSSSPVTVSDGGVLSGNGTLGTLTISAGGFVSPGSSPGTLTIGTATWEGSGGFGWEVNNATGVAGASSGWDKLVITGLLDITASESDRFLINITSLTLSNLVGNTANFDPTLSYSFNFITAGSINGFASDKFTLNTAGFANSPVGTWSIAQNGPTLDLVYTGVAAVPEPATYAVWIGFAALLVGRWRNRRKAHDRDRILA